MLARAFPEAQVLVDPQRSRSARYAEEHFSPDLIIADDAFQHLALERDYNLVLLTPADLTCEWNRVIPSGSWREDASALQDAQAVLLRLPVPDRGNPVPGSPPWAGVPNGPLLAAQDASYWLDAVRQRFGAIPCFPFYCRPGPLRCLGRGDPPGSLGALTEIEAGVTHFGIPVELRERPYNLFCGVGAPQGVRESAVALLGREPLKFTAFPDHHAYSREDVLNLLAGGVDLVCTEKDAVKLEALFPDLLAQHPVWAMGLQIEFLEGRDERGEAAAFPQFWEREWPMIRTSHSALHSRPGQESGLARASAGDPDSPGE